jgi:cytochrome b subunit of formate dehydrogenase
MRDYNNNGMKKIKRFCTARIIEHWLLIIVFAILLTSGLSQKFHSLEISMWFVMKMGGIDSVRLVHRYAGAFFSMFLISHIVITFLGVVLRKWQPLMLIKKNDLSDAVHNIKYYIGIENQPARCDRFDYKEKFAYWCVLTGGMIMIATGFSLWFPATIVSLLPGETIPTAKALHTNEALLIFLLITLWHIYDSIFSPNVFPLDTSIFTGYISRDRMLYEHPIELARIEGKSLEELYETPQDEAPEPEK